MSLVKKLCLFFFTNVNFNELHDIFVGNVSVLADGINQICSSDHVAKIANFTLEVMDMLGNKVKLKVCISTGELNSCGVAVVNNKSTCS